MFWRGRSYTLFALTLASSFALFAVGSANADAVPTQDGGRWSEVGPHSPPGWKEFLAAVTFLQDQRDRAKAAELFRAVARDFPDAEYVDPASTRRKYADQAKELAELLTNMAVEDKAWTEPQDVDRLSVEERIRYDMYHLRDVRAYQWGQPGMCDVLDDSARKWMNMPDEYNAAIDLRSIGEPAIPSLLGILDDRRPIRSVGYWRHYFPSRTVLRYQDAAIQILSDLLPVAFYRRSSTWAYLSNEPPEEREQLIAHVRQWYEEAKGKPFAEQKWLAVNHAGVWPALHTLKSLAINPKEKDRVLAELHHMYDERHWIFQPLIAKTMAELGDTSKVREVLQYYRQGRYSISMRHPDDGDAAGNARDAADVLVREYGVRARLLRLVGIAGAVLVLFYLLYVWRRSPTPPGRKAESPSS